MNTPINAFAVQTASDNSVVLAADKISTLTMSRDADPNLCMVTVVYKHGQGERNFRLHDQRAKELQAWLNDQSEHLQADHSNGMSVWIAKAQEGKGPNIGNLIEAMLGARTPGEAQIEQHLMTMFSTARDVKFTDDFIMDFTPALMLVMKSVARVAAHEELMRFKKAHAYVFDKGAPGQNAVSPSNVIDVLQALVSDGEAIQAVLEEKRRAIRNEDKAAAREAGTELSQTYFSDAEQRYIKLSMSMKRMTDTAHLALGVQRVRSAGEQS